LETVFQTDLSFGGQRGVISLSRYYRTLSTFAGPFGIGTHHNYGYRLDTPNFQSAALINLVTPDGNRFPFTKELTLAPPGSLTPPPNELRNFTNPAMIGAVMTVLPTEVLLRWKNGTVYRFLQPNPQFTPQLDSIVDPNGNRITIARNGNNPNQVLQITDPTGRSLRLTYDGASRITSVTDPIGRIVSYTYNAQGTLETVTDPEGGITRYEYDNLNRMIKETDARGIVVAQNTYDATGRVATQTQADDGVFLFEYAFVNPTIPNSPILATTVTDPLGKRTIHRFTPVGFRTDTNLANGQLVAIDRHALTNKVIARRPIGTDVGKEAFEYDNRGNLLRQTDALGGTTVYTYDATFNKMTSIRDALGNTTSFTYDSRGNLQSRTDGNNHRTSYRYDTSGLLTEVTDATGQKTRFEYDTLGNLVRVIDALGNATQLRYDGASRLVERLDSLGRKRSMAYDGLDRVVRETDAKGQTTTFAYDRVGNLLSVTDARNKATGFEFDAMSRLVSRTDPLGNADARTYDSNRNMLSFRDRRGQTSAFAYDDVNRLIVTQHADGSRVERRYDSFGRLVQATDSGVMFGFEYDVAGGLLRSTGPFGTVQYQRDALGRIVIRQVAGQAAVTYNYDGSGNLLTAAMPGASVGFTYNARNQPTALSRSNGVATNYLYDPVGQPLSIVHARGSTPLQSLAYSYDASGDRISQQMSDGQPLATQMATATYDDANRLVQRGNTTFAYDDNGNLTSELGPSGTTTYTWDARNRLASLSASTGQLKQFQYDFGGNLISQTDSGPLANVTRTFVSDSLTNVAHQQSSDGDQYSVLTGGSIDSHFATIRSGAQVEFALSDALNSTVSTVDQAGILKGTFSYAPFGETASSGSSYPFQYTGRVLVANSLYYYRARFYSAITERFISEDPLGFSAGVNVFAYAGNRPVLFNDPFGLDYNIANPLVQTPGASPQDRVCTVPGRTIWADTPCRRRACATHDSCYLANGCTADSWLGPQGGNACDQCNSRVLNEFADCREPPICIRFDLPFSGGGNR
jgi:RHS repeat-associated protein